MGVIGEPTTIPAYTGVVNKVSFDPWLKSYWTLLLLENTQSGHSRSEDELEAIFVVGCCGGRDEEWKVGSFRLLDLKVWIWGRARV